MSKDRALTGAAGEHYVAFRLAAMGYAVGLTTRGTRTVDMVVANPDTGKSITIDKCWVKEDDEVEKRALEPLGEYGGGWCPFCFGSRFVKRTKRV